VAQAHIVAVEVLKLRRRSAAKELQVVKDNPDKKTEGIGKEERCNLVIRSKRNSRVRGRLRCRRESRGGMAVTAWRTRTMTTVQNEGEWRRSRWRDNKR